MFSMKKRQQYGRCSLIHVGEPEHRDGGRMAGVTNALRMQNRKETTRIEEETRQSPRKNWHFVGASKVRTIYEALATKDKLATWSPSPQQNAVCQQWSRFLCAPLKPHASPTHLCGHVSLIRLKHREDSLTGVVPKAS